MSDADKSLRSDAPYDGKPGATAAAVANDFGVLKFTGGASGTETTHAANELPTHWHGREIGIVVADATEAAAADFCYVAFSTSSSAEVDRTVSATAAGDAAKVGLPIPVNPAVEVRLRLPVVGTAKLYFVRESSATGVVCYLRLLA